MCWLSACDVSFSFCFTIKSEIHCVGCFEEIMDGGSLPWRFSIVNLKVVSHGDWNTVINQYEGLEMSQLGDVSDSSLHRVLKWVNLGPKTWGSWKESSLGAKCKGLERSQFVTFCHISHCDGLERSHFCGKVIYRIVLNACLAFLFAERWIL